jgi:serine/threonine protein phosphatase 1
MFWIIGDIHGMVRPLEGLLAAVARRDAAAKIIFVGDYVNRGAESKQVIDLLTALPQATFLRGNHDDIFDLILHGDCYTCHPSAPDRVTAFTWFFQHGLAETLMSYGADLAILESVVRRPSDRAIVDCVSIVPQAHRQFIRSLKPFYETVNFFVAHGYWDPDDADDAIGSALESDARRKHQLLWGRFGEQDLWRKKRWKRRGVFGHTPVMTYAGSSGATPLQAEKLTLVDTAVALTPSGFLSAFCPESDSILQASRDGQTIELY